jgi:hypothetical protein
MSTAKVRVSGAWVDTELTGKHRVAGAWEDFGPSGGPTLETLSWPSPPSLTDGDDGENYSMGALFHLLESKLCYGVEWKVPDTVVNPSSGTHAVALWDLAPIRLAYKTFTPVPGTVQQIIFDTPVSLLAAPSEYLVSVLTRHYSFRAPSPSSDWLVESPSLNIRHNSSRLSATSDPTTIPGGSFNAWYYVSPIMEV